jgi:hypothetical protein
MCRSVWGLFGATVVKAKRSKKKEFTYLTIKKDGSVNVKASIRKFQKSLLQWAAMREAQQDQLVKLVAAGLKAPTHSTATKRD